MKRILIFHGILLIGSIALFFYGRHVSIKDYEEATNNAPFDVIIVPGYPYKDSTWSDVMKARVYWSKHLFDRGLAHHVIYSGSAVYSPYVEAKVMKIYGEALGLPADRLFAETRAEHSTENLYYSFHLAKERGFEKIALATDPFQSFFLRRFAHDEGLEVGFIPIQFGMLDQLAMQDPIIDASDALVDDFTALPDRQGFWERFQGTMGKHIKEAKD